MKDLTIHRHFGIKTMLATNTDNLKYDIPECPETARSWAAVFGRKRTRGFLCLEVIPMFAHQVIEDLGSESKNTMNLLKRLSSKQDFIETMKKNVDIAKSFAQSTMLAFNMMQLKEMIQQAQKFHLGLQTNNNCPVELNKKTPLFTAPPSSDVRPPYKLTYFDWPVDFHSDEPERRLYGSDELAPQSMKRAVLCEEICKDIICVFVFNYINISKRWDVSPVGTISIIGKSLKDLEPEDFNKIKRTFLKYAPIYDQIDPGLMKYEQKIKNSSYNSTIIPLIPMDSDQQEHFVEENADELKIIAAVLVLLSCKNITTETVSAPVKLNNKRKKKGKLPIYSYKTLIIKPTTKQQQSIPKHLWNNRIHLARGHFKTYTKEKPLFGSITGRFWWQPHVRGQNRDGVVMKDYKVEMKN
jgi:hypothetical protein